ncbi:MAG: hypothetical protein ABL921_11810 [Pirellula sp.]
MRRRAISFSLWGSNHKYTGGAVQNAILANEIYPEWDCVFHVGDSTPESVLVELSQYQNVRVIETKSPGNWTSSLWRFMLIDTGYYDAVIIRDCDSRLSYRERAAVEQWLQENRAFHVMRDHPQHATEIMAGMWGVRKGAINFTETIHAYPKLGDYWQVDQNYLRDVVWPIAISSNTTHDEFFVKRKFPFGMRHPSHFVGQAYDGDGKALDTKENFWDYLPTQRIEYEKYRISSRE